MWTILIIGICILLNAILAGFEIAYVITNKTFVKNLVHQGDKKAKALLNLKEKPERTLSTIQVGITLIAVLSAAVGGAEAGLVIVPFLLEAFQLSLPLAEVIAIILVVVPITYFSVVIGEIAPKSFVIRHPYYYASLGAPAVLVLSRLFYPVVKVCELSTKKLLRLFDVTTEKAEEDEYEKIVKGFYSLPLKGKEYAINLFKIQDKNLEDILLVWDEVEYVAKSEKLDQVIEKIISTGHTRMPVVENDQVIGFINTKEILALEKSSDYGWQDFIRSPIRLQKDASPLYSLNILQKKRIHMAIVEENSKPLGIVTLEDIIEEVLGEIYDEDDEGSLKKILGK